MVLNESELFALHSPRLLMNTSILFWKIVLPSCGIFFNAISSNLEAGKGLNAKRLPSPQDALPCIPALPHLPHPTCARFSASASEAAQECRGRRGACPTPPQCFHLSEIGSRRSEALQSESPEFLLEGHKHGEEVPPELKSSAGCLIGCVVSRKG